MGRDGPSRGAPALAGHVHAVGDEIAPLEAAQEHGQIRGDADLGTVVDLIRGACCIRLLLPYLTVTQ
ncbi:hypothetical protein [Streptomyces sp. NBC_01361]|uniref:hypothetical protein n=1 Tax=Streptomyces sp. NBC_01361 TaxID=2903838 RepID=UPI002E364FAB|nr:hypothetical protein [Streptomyces sp. NBC_01361]